MAVTFAVPDVQGTLDEPRQALPVDRSARAGLDHRGVHPFLVPVSPKGIPGNPNFTWKVVNYAPLTVGGALILFGGWYLLSARRWFKGPVREAETEQDLESIERSLQQRPRSGRAC